MYSKHQWLQVAQRLQSIAQAGLTYAESGYDLERYHQIMGISKDIITGYTTMTMEKVNRIFDGETGYLTPKVDVRGLVFRGNQLLFVRETVDGRWSLPGGWADVGYSPSEMVEKEVIEEAGLTVTATRLLAVLDKKCHPHPPDLYYVYKFFFLCEETGGELRTSIETSEVGFFGLDNLPELSEPRNTRSQIELMYRLKNELNGTLFD